MPLLSACRLLGGEPELVYSPDDSAIGRYPNESPHRSVSDVLIDVSVDFGPLVVSAVGVVGGTVIGLYLALRAASRVVRAGAV